MVLCDSPLLRLNSFLMLGSLSLSKHLLMELLPMRKWVHMVTTILLIETP